MPVWFVCRGAGGRWGQKCGGSSRSRTGDVPSLLHKSQRSAASSPEKEVFRSAFLSRFLCVSSDSGSGVGAAVAPVGREMVVLLCRSHGALLFSGSCVHEITAHEPSPGWRARAHLTIPNENTFLSFTLKFCVFPPAATTRPLLKQARLLFCISWDMGTRSSHS